MPDTAHQVELDDKEIATLVAILKFSLDWCPIETISDGVDIDHDLVEDLAARLGKIGASG